MSTTRQTTSGPSRPATGVPPEGTNLVVVRGTLSRDPERRALPSGDSVVAYDVTVRSERGTAPPRAESVPVAWFEPPAAATALSAGDEVVVVGRVRRRFFRAGGATASRTEVVATRVVPVRARAKVRAAMAAAIDALVDGG